VELGIAEVNLVGLLGELGVSFSRDGQPLFPIGTIYDPFLMRCYEPWAFGIYAGGQSILVGTPSGVTLGPEGGAHQSVVTPAAVLGQPGVTYWEPAFGQDFEWCFLHAIAQLGREGGASAYFRLSTRPLDQELAALPDDPAARERRRLDALAGAYVLREAPGAPAVTICAAGAVLPGALAAADELEHGGVGADVICVTSPDLIYRALRGRSGLEVSDWEVLDRVFHPARAAPIVTVLDGHPHALAFLGQIRGVPCGSLGVTEFGQSGDIADLFVHHGIDSEAIIGSALDLVGQ
jgi:pyruvate dehydrogenase E1 component